MRKTILSVLALLLLTATALASPINDGGYFKGKVRIVDAFPDIKVQVVSSFPDLKVKVVESFPDEIGEWQFVEHGEDFTIQFVDAFPDIKIKYVTAFPGLR